MSITHVTITTSVAISDSLRAKTLKTLQSKYPESTVELTQVIDTSLIGGVTVMINGTEYDASIAGKLKAVAAALRTQA